MNNPVERHDSDLVTDAQNIIEEAVHEVTEMNTKATDVEWLEDLTA